MVLDLLIRWPMRLGDRGIPAMRRICFPFSVSPGYILHGTLDQVYKNLGKRNRLTNA